MLLMLQLALGSNLVKRYHFTGRMCSVCTVTQDTLGMYGMAVGADHEEVKGYSAIPPWIGMCLI